MKRLLLLLLLWLPVFGARAQQMRYFEFKTQCGYNQWRDTSFIAATSDPAVIADVLADLTKPADQRKLIIGTLAPGNGGFNRNATYQFGWHFVPGQWHLQQMAMEVCDGCPYSDIDLNPDYWLQQIGEFCPWTSAVAREVTAPLSAEEETDVTALRFFPNPASGKITLELPAAGPTEIRLMNSLGATVKTVRNQTELDLQNLPAGLYVLAVTQHGKVQRRRLVVE